MSENKLQVVRDEEVNVESKITIELPLHTIILLVGPPNCGKTSFTSNCLIPGLKSQASNTGMSLNVQHVSSDAIRRMLLDDPMMDKMAEPMSQVGGQAFDMLYSWVRNATSYPVNADFVVVDTTGMNAQFRDDIEAIAKENHYNLVCVMFDYKNRSDYYQAGDEQAKGWVTHKSVDRFKREVISQLKRKMFSQIIRINNRDFDSYNFRITNFGEMYTRFLPSGIEYIVIGDVHGCYDEMLELLALNGVEVRDGMIVEDITKKVVFIGDLIDKGGKVREVLEFVYENIDSVLLVMGNHENFVYKYFNGLLDKDAMKDPKVMDRHYSSIPLLQEDEELRRKFFVIYSRMKEFFWNSNFILTHAPCSLKYLGKLDNQSIRNQRYAESAHRENFKDDESFIEARIQRFKFLEDSANSHHPLHIFGHIMTRSISSLKNKINIDTGCVAGNKLSSISLTANSRPVFRSVASTNPMEDNGLLNFFQKAPKDFKLEELSAWETSRMMKAADNKVNVITGTIAPADKDEETADLESIEKGVSYFIGKKVNSVVVQPKYMGSRATVYLFANPEQSYVTSRGGFIVKNDNLEQAIDELYKLPYVIKRFSEGVKMIVIDSELLPWRANGANLIDKEFVATGAAITAEAKFLVDNGFYQAIESYSKNVYEPSEYQHKHLKTKRTELAELYGSDKESNLRVFHDYRRQIISQEDLQLGVDVFNRQLELYARDGKVEFKPFSLLKEVLEDDSEKLFFDNTNDFVFSAVSSDNFIVVDLPDKDKAVQEITEFYDYLTTVEGMEGIMLKPHQIYLPGVAPAVKVRNKNYLTLIYGPNYQSEGRLKHLLEKKSIKGKLKLSVAQWNTGKKMLEIPYSEINRDNMAYLDSFAKMIFEEKEEEKIDHRL